MTQELDANHDDRRANLILPGLAVLYFFLVWIPGIIGPYRYFIDEFYYLACADHPALGYVDHPPLSVFLLWLVRALIGDSLAALRVVPALAGALTVLFVGLIAGRLGAKAFGQALAAGAAMIGSVYHVVFSNYSMNALSLLMWTACFWILVEIERRNAPRLWLLLGVLIGLGLENKHTFILLPLALAPGVLLSSARRHLRSGWLWLGCFISVVLIAPNLVWQMVNGWPSVEFYRNADLYKNIPTPPLMVLEQQILMMNPGALPVWVAGLWFFLAAKQGRGLRHLGWLYLVLLAFMLVGQKSRPDRIAGVYTILLAGGGVLLGNLLGRPRLRWLRWVLPAVLVIAGAALVPLGLTVFSPDRTARYAASLGVVPQIEKGEGKRTALPQWMSDRLGWEEFVDDVEAVVNAMDPAERSEAIILVPTYGQAGALELLGRGRNLPPVYATQNSYFHWGPPPDPVEVVVIGGAVSEGMVRRYFNEATVARVHECDWCTPWRRGLKIWLARGPKMSMADAWPELKNYE